ncbi:MAG: hypothetical protein ABIE84_01955 [bacterium]
MQYVKIEKDGSITLPREARKAFPARSELALWWEGDVLLLKRVAPTRPTEYAERAAQKGPSLAKLAKEIHKIRKVK